MARETPRVDGATLIDGTDAAEAILVGTPAWYAWLDRATTFAFVDASGRFTARKERRQGTAGYWKAYRKRAGVVRSTYLGKTAELALERLQAAAAALAEPSAPPGAAPSSDRDLPPLTTLHDLSEHHLKDLSRPERIFQLMTPDLPSEDPPLSAQERSRYSLLLRQRLCSAPSYTSPCFGPSSCRARAYWPGLPRVWRNH
jgi:hypothetical protein